MTGLGPGRLTGLRPVTGQLANLTSVAPQPAPKRPRKQTPPKGADEVREALVKAAMHLLPRKGPGGVSGRDLAERAKVNYGLLHHYFGTKQAVFTEAFLRMRADFIERHGTAGSAELVLDQQDPFLRTIVWTSLIDPKVSKPVRDGLMAGQQLDALRERMPASTPAAALKARAMLLQAAQLGMATNLQMLFEIFRVDSGERDAVEAELRALYRELGG